MLGKGKRAEKGGFEMEEKNIYVRAFNGEKRGTYSKGMGAGIIQLLCI